MSEASAVAGAGAGARVSLGVIFWTFLTAGAISFGGGVVAYLREYTVRNTKWLDDEAFLDALEISQTLPGLNAVNMSVIIGDKLRGIPGAAVAVLGLVFPGVVVIMGLGAVWQEQAHNPQVRAFLIGVASTSFPLALVMISLRARTEGGVAQREVRTEAFGDPFGTEQRRRSGGFNWHASFNWQKAQSCRRPPRPIRRFQRSSWRCKSRYERASNSCRNRWRHPSPRCR